MFEFSTVLLAALFAAAACDLVLGWRAAPAGQNRCKAALRQLWHAEHFLLGGWGAAWRQKAGQVLFIAGVAVYEFNVTFCNSMARENWPWVQGILAECLNWGMCLCFGLKILLGTKYTWRSLGVAGCLYFIARWVYFNSQNVWWFGIILVLMAAKDVPLARPLRAFLASGAAGMMLVAALHFAGIVSPGLLSERMGEYRQTYGYGHPNTFGGLLLGLVLAFALLRAHRPRWGDIAAIAAAGIFLQVGPGSRSAAITCLILAILYTAYRLFPQFWSKRHLPALGAGLVGVFAAVSYLLPFFLVKIGPWNTDFGPAWLAKLDSLLTCRISMSWVAYRMFPLKIAGSVLLDWPALDNSFVFSLYQFGPVVTVLWALLVAWTIYALLRVRRTPEALCLIALLFYSYMECQVFHFTTNPAVLLLCSRFFALPLHALSASPQGTRCTPPKGK